MDQQKQNEKFAEIHFGEDDFQKLPRFGIRHFQIAVMTFTVFSLFIARSSMGVAVLAMAGDARNGTSVEVYNWDKTTQGLILSSFFWGYVMMQIPGGMLGQKFGGKPVLLVTLLVNAVLCCLLPTFAAVGGWPLVCAARVAMGLSQACLFSATFGLMGKWLPPKERTGYSGLINGGSQIGTIIAMPVSGILTETALGWKTIFYAMSGLLFVTAAVWYWFAASNPSEHRMIGEAERQFIEKSLNNLGSHKSMPTPWKKILTSVPAWAIIPAQTGFVMSFVLFFVDMPTYLEKGLRISLKDSASLSALPFMGMWVGNIVSCIISEKLINSNIISIGTSRKLFNSIAMFGVTGALIGLSFIGPEQKSLAVIFLIVSLTLIGFVFSGSVVNYLDLSPNFAGVLVSLANFVANFGSIVMPLGTSYILNNDPSNIERWRIVFLITGAIAAGTNILYIIFGSSEKQPWNDPDISDEIKADNPELMKPVLSDEDQKELEERKSLVDGQQKADITFNTNDDNDNSSLQ